MYKKGYQQEMQLKKYVNVFSVASLSAATIIAPVYADTSDVNLNRQQVGGKTVQLVIENVGFIVKAYEIKLQITGDVELDNVTFPKDVTGHYIYDKDKDKDKNEVTLYVTSKESLLDSNDNLIIGTFTFEGKTGETFDITPEKNSFKIVTTGNAEHIIPTLSLSGGDDFVIKEINNGDSVGGGNESTQQPPTETPKPPTDNGTDNNIGDGNGNSSNGNSGSTGGSSTGGSSSDGNTGGSNNDTETEDESAVDKPTTSENEFKVDLEGLDEAIKEKVDSLIVGVTSQKNNNEFILSVDGEKDDLSSLSIVTVNENGIFMTVDDTEVLVTDKVPETNIDFKNARVMRVIDNAISPVMHYTSEKGLQVTSSNLQNLLITPRINEPFTDVENTHWFKSDVEEAYNYGFTLGTSATTYSPYNEITRGEFVVMLARALELQPSSNESNFKDINSKWYKGQVQALYEKGIVKGNADGTFGGENKITRQEAATFITRMLTHMNVDVTVENTVEFIDMHNISAFAKDSVQYLATKGVLVGGGDNKFNPTNNLTRAEMAKILVRSLRLSNWY